MNKSESANPSNIELLNLVAKAEQLSRDELESTGKGYAFTVSEKVRNMPDEQLPRFENDQEGISKQALLKVTLGALKDAWEQAIKPRLVEIRAKKATDLKHGNDFFTEADTGSEETIKQKFLDAFGEQSLRIFGEEANKYLGNNQSQIGIRIDPIDGTESFKFSKNTDWGIMIGVYVGPAETEQQIISGVYMPEREMLMYSVEGAGVFTTALTESRHADADSLGVKEYGAFENRDDLSDIIVGQWKHTDYKQRGSIKEIEDQLAKLGARMRSSDSACADVIEALQSDGKRAMIIDGDFNQVDFIPHGALEKLGYKIYDWEGNKKRTDDPELTNKKLVVVPPGKAGEQILAIIRNVNSTSEKNA